MIKVTFVLLFLLWWMVNPNDVRSINRYTIIMTCLFVLMMGLRSEAIYGDTYGYFLAFQEVRDMNIPEITERWPKDTYYYIFCHFIHPFIFHSYTLWLFLIAIFYMVPLSKIIRNYSVSPIFSWLCFIFIGFMMFAMTGIRQTIAFSFMFIAFLYLMSGKNKLFFLFIAFAFVFHGTSLICLLMYPLSKMRFNKVVLIVYLILFFVLMVIGKNVLQHMTTFLGESDLRYISYGNNLLGSNYTYMLFQAFLIFPSLYILRERLNEPLIALFAHFCMVAFLFVSLSPVIAEMFRVSMYYSWAIMILFPMAMMEYSKRDSLLPNIYILFFVVYFFFISKLFWNDYYFFFEDTTQLINSYYIGV